MKKLFAIFLCVVICLSFVGCKPSEKESEVAKQETEVPTQETEAPKQEPEKAKEMLQKVLNREQTFSFKSLVFDKITEEDLDRFSFPSEGNAIKPSVTSNSSRPSPSKST